MYYFSYSEFACNNRWSGIKFKITELYLVSYSCRNVEKLVTSSLEDNAMGFKIRIQ